MNQNFQQFMQMLKSVKNPQQMVSQLMKNNNNPVFNKLIDMANKGDIEGLTNFGRNMYQEKGMNFDEEYQNFQNTMDQFK